MRNDMADLMAEALAQPSNAIHYYLSRRLQEAFPDRYLLETQSWAFDVRDFADEGLCLYDAMPGIHTQIEVRPGERFESVLDDTYNGWFAIEWEGHEFQLISIGVQESHCRTMRHFLLAPSQELGQRFFLAVCEWNAEVRGEVLVYREGWQKDANLFEAIKGSTLDNLLLEDGLKETIQLDFETFFRSRRTYERYGIPWKRGVLLLGPPGNGKTHCIKALINLLGLPCLYVRTFEQEYGTDQSSISQVFARARQTAPCVLVMEDLESLLTDANRSFFLNELDGFASNAGIMVVATTNHPERLDPAILERPSRFDRKYTFNLPDEKCRREYLKLFSGNLEPELWLSDEQAQTLAEATDGFSFAYLKELFLSAMMAWIHDSTSSMEQVMQSQVVTLKDQMVTAMAAPTVDEPRADTAADIAAYMKRWSQ